MQKSGARTSVSYSPNQTRPEAANALRLVFRDNNGAENTREWEFTSKVETGSGTASMSKRASSGTNSRE